MIFTCLSKSENTLLAIQTNCAIDLLERVQSGDCPIDQALAVLRGQAADFEQGAKFADLSLQVLANEFELPKVPA